MILALQFVTQADPISWAIRRITWSEYSHVDLVLPDGRLLGARWDGVKIRKPEYSKFAQVKRVQVKVPDDAGRRVIALAMQQVSKPYDYWAICNFFLHRSHNWRDERRWFCSELVAWCFATAGVPLLNTPDCDRISPRDLMLSPAESG